MVTYVTFPRRVAGRKILTYVKLPGSSIVTHSGKALGRSYPAFPQFSAVLIFLVAAAATSFLLDQDLLGRMLTAGVFMVALSRVVTGLRRANVAIDQAWAVLDPPHESSRITTPEEQRVSR